MAGEVPDFDPSAVLDRKEIRRNDRTTQLALVATARGARRRRACRRGSKASWPSRPGSSIGSGLGGTGTLIDQIGTWATRGPDRLSPFFIPMAIVEHGGGPGGDHVRRARAELRDDERLRLVRATRSARRPRSILRGDAEVMLARRLRGAGPRGDGRRVRGDARALDAQRRPGRRQPPVRRRAATASSSPRAPRRSSSRSSSTPAARGARIYAEVLGYAATADAHHITTPAPGGTGAVRAARRALQKGGLDASEIDLVSAHATSTPGGRPDRARRDQHDRRRPRERGQRHRHEVVDRAHARRGGRGRGRRDRQGARARRRPADAEPRTTPTRRPAPST